MIKFEQLYYLYLVNHFNSIKLAAESIPVSPAAVSTAIHKLEKESELPLLNRTYRGIELTETAQKICSVMAKIVDNMDDIQKIVDDARHTEQDNSIPKINFYFSRGYYQGSLVVVIDFFEKFGIEINAPDVSYGNEKYLQFVNDDENAVLLNFFAEPADELLLEYPNVCYHRLSTSRPCIYCAEDYPNIPPEVKEITPQEVCKLPILLFQEGYDLAMPILEMVEAYGKLNIVGKYNNITVMSAMIAKNKGVSVVAQDWLCFGDPAITAADIGARIIPIKTNMRISIIVCYNKKLPPKTQNLLKKICKEVVSSY